MKKLWKTIRESNYKWWLLVLVVLIFISIGVYFLIVGDFQNSKLKSILDVIIIGVLVSLVINLISSFVTIIFIEERDKKEANKQEKARQSVAFQLLIKAIMEFITFLR